MAPIVGIDLGTTNSVLAYLTPSGPEIIPNALGGRLTPSVVGITDEGKILVGAAAKELQVMRPDRCVSIFKRWMGSDRKTTIAGQSYLPEELSGMVLRSLKQDAESFFKEEVTRAVITVPAYFSESQRKATIAAGQIAGFKVERILNEPTAASIAYGFFGAKQNQTMLIFDLGGGTFDVSIVEDFEGTLEVKASAGETSLGGEDFTRAMASRILEANGMPFERTEATMPLVVSRMIQQCEKAKCQLSKETSVMVRIPDQSGKLDGGKEVTVTREQFQEWVQRTLSRVEIPIRRALGDAKLSRDKIDEVILVGGATRMPIVVERVTELFGKAPHCRLNPDEVVALGAAVQAGLVEQNAAVNDMVVTDVSPFTLGLEVAKEFGSEIRSGFFDPIIDRNSVIPVSRAKTYSTMHPNQTQILVKVFQGESRKVTENLLLGEVEVAGIPAGPPGQQVEIRFSYDLNGILEVEAMIVATKKKVTKVITKHASGLSEAEIRKAVAAMAKLKSHPREDAENVYVLRRAERIYQEIPAALRRELTYLLDGFEQALESQDPEAIKQYRLSLQTFLSAYEPDENNQGEASDE
ncbi:MAG: Hsp70 family protein [Fimbriiglobus sp.]